MSQTVEQVRAHYEHQPEREWYRLVRHRVEYAVTLRALRDILPEQARVLDVGGGPGRYAVALAGAGHAVTLVDISPRLLERARAHAAERKVRLAAIVEASATDLSCFDCAAFDTVLLLGPLYHLPDEGERRLALCEAFRVLTPGGVLAASFLTRYGPLRQLARSDPGLLIRFPTRYEALLEHGILPGPPRGEEAVQGYYAQPGEITPLLTDAGFDSVRLLAVESILDSLDDRVAALRGPEWQAWADLLYDLADDPGILASAAHILALARRPALAHGGAARRPATAPMDHTL
jgi:SAM-dependent methyltransferase